MAQLKLAIILSTPGDWEPWIQLVKSHAKGLDIWQYLDPDIEVPEPLIQPIVPTAEATIATLRAEAAAQSAEPSPPATSRASPHSGEFHTPSTGTAVAHSPITVLKSQVERRFKSDTIRYSQEIQLYNNRVKALGSMPLLIQTSVSDLYREYTYDCTPREMLVSLKQRVAPSDYAAVLDLRHQYKFLTKPPASASLDQWVNRWEQVFTKAKRHKMPEAEAPTPHLDFLNAIEHVAPSFYTVNHDQLLDQLEQGNKPDFITLINKFRQDRRINRALHAKSRSGQSIFATTLQGRELEPTAEPAEPSAPLDKPDKDKDPRTPPECICGVKHWYRRCPYIIPSVRKKGWNPDPEIQAKFDALKDSKKAFFKRLAERVAKQAEKRSAKKDTSDSPDQRNRDLGPSDQGRHTVFTVIRNSATLEIGSQPLYPLRNSFILDSGATLHVCNDRSRFLTYTPAEEVETATAVGPEAQIYGYGTAMVHAQGLKGTETLLLTDTAFIPDSPTSLVSYRRIKDAGGTWDDENNCLKQNGQELCKVMEIENQFVLEYRPPTDDDKQRTILLAALSKAKRRRRANPRLSTLPKKSAASGDIWHSRLGHPSNEVLKHLNEATEGAIVTSPPSDSSSCEACCLSNTHQLISRRPPQNPATEPFERVHFDIVHHIEAYNNHNHMHHLFDEYTKIHLVETTVHDGDGMTLEILEYWYRLIFDRYKRKIKFIRLDNECTLKVKFENWCQSKNPPIIIERSPPYTPQPNGAAERSGGVIDNKATTLRIYARLPETLWPEAVKATAYLLNLLPTRGLNWTSPIQFINIFMGRKKTKINIGHLYAYGCRVYVYIHPDEPERKGNKKHKLRYKARIGYLVGYDSSNIFRVWYPRKNIVVSARDVRFDETKFWDPREPDLDEILLVEPPNYTSVDLYEQSSLVDAEVNSSTLPINDSDPDQMEEDDDAPADLMDDVQIPENLLVQLPQDSPQPVVIPKISNLLPTPQSTPEYERPSLRAQAHFAAVTNVQNESGFHAAFATALHLAHKARIHRDQLPSPPKSWRELLKHPHKAQFTEAAHREIEALKQKHTFQEIDRPTGKQILPLLWVFTYKYDTDGFLTKYKARICVRGDLQAPSKEDNYAATLAAKTLRFLCAIITAFDLETVQFDAVNAFLHSPLEEDIYVQYPDGFRVFGKCLHLRKALYGLRQSPRLWQKHFSSILTDYGLKRVDDEICLYVNSWLIVFFFVDDIVGTYHPTCRHRISNFITHLKARVEVKELGELNWFLGIRVIRDRSKHKMWLCQDSYIEKIAQRFNLVPERAYDTPLPVLDLDSLVREIQASPEAIYGYQQRVGSIQFAACSTRPDVAKHASKLAEFQLNPAPEHIHLADRVIQYLYHTRYMAITVTGNMHTPICLAYSDASLGDDTITRRSSHGYLITLFGGAIDWKAGKQKAVATSTTEAELRALEYAARETYWLNRVFKSIDFDPGDPISIFCDNRQTLRLLQSQVPVLNTRLKHVDIAHHWLRQEVQAGRLHVAWIPTSLQAADGLTKILPRQKHEIFMKQLGMEAVPMEFIHS